MFLLYRMPNWCVVFHTLQSMIFKKNGILCKGMLFSGSYSLLHQQTTYKSGILEKQNVFLFMIVLCVNETAKKNFSAIVIRAVAKVNLSKKKFGC